MPDTSSGKTKSSVIFYDACVPKKHFKNIVLPAISEAADNIFVREVFAEKICRDDWELFSAVAATHQETYGGRICVFVTCDLDFKKTVRGHPALEYIHIIFVGPCTSQHVAELRAEETLKKIFEFLA